MAAKDGSTRYLSNPNMGLVGLGFQPYHMVIGDTRTSLGQMLVVKLLVAFYQGISYLPVKGGTHMYGPRPVLRQYGKLHAGEVPIFHMHETPLGKPRPALVLILKVYRPHQHSPLHIQLLAVIQDIHRAQIKPAAIFNSEAQRQPVGDINHTLVLNSMTSNLALQAVIQPGDICAGVMNTAGIRLRSRPPAGKVAIAQGTQGFTEFFSVRFEPFIDKRPYVN